MFSEPTFAPYIVNPINPSNDSHSTTYNTSFTNYSTSHSWGSSNEAGLHQKSVNPTDNAITDCYPNQDIPYQPPIVFDQRQSDISPIENSMFFPLLGDQPLVDLYPTSYTFPTFPASPAVPSIISPSLPDTHSQPSAPINISDNIPYNEYAGPSQQPLWSKESAQMSHQERLAEDFNLFGDQVVTQQPDHDFRNERAYRPIGERNSVPTTEHTTFVDLPMRSDAFLDFAERDTLQDYCVVSSPVHYCEKQLAQQLRQDNIQELSGSTDSVPMEAARTCMSKIHEVANTRQAKNSCPHKVSTEGNTRRKATSQSCIPRERNAPQNERFGPCPSAGQVTSSSGNAVEQRRKRRKTSKPSDPNIAGSRTSRQRLPEPDLYNPTAGVTAFTVVGPPHKFIPTLALEALLCTRPHTKDEKDTLPANVSRLPVSRSRKSPSGKICKSSKPRKPYGTDAGSIANIHVIVPDNIRKTSESRR